MGASDLGSLNAGDEHYQPAPGLSALFGVGAGIQSFVIRARGWLPVTPRDPSGSTTPFAVLANRKHALLSTDNDRGRLASAFDASLRTQPTFATATTQSCARVVSDECLAATGIVRRCLVAVRSRIRADRVRDFER